MDVDCDAVVGLSRGMVVAIAEVVVFDEVVLVCSNQCC